MCPEYLKEKFFNLQPTTTAKLTKTIIGEILTERNNEIVLDPIENLGEADLRQKNAQVY